MGINNKYMKVAGKPTDFWTCSRIINSKCILCITVLNVWEVSKCSSQYNVSCTHDLHSMRQVHVFVSCSYWVLPGGSQGRRCKRIHRHSHFPHIMTILYPNPVILSMASTFLNECLGLELEITSFGWGYSIPKTCWIVFVLCLPYKSGDPAQIALPVLSSLIWNCIKEICLVAHFIQSSLDGVLMFCCCKLPVAEPNKTYFHTVFAY